MRLPFTDNRLPFLQDLIHRFEEGGGNRYLRWLIVALLFLILLAGYNLRAFRNFGTQEAMDMAQVARNVSEGKGYSTSFVRPFSIYLLKQRNTEQKRHLSDPARLKGNHPDITNPPAYPVLLAGLMKALPFDFTAHTAKRFWSKNGILYRFQPDFLISLFNQFLFFIVVFLVFKLAKRLFDNQVAWVSALALLGTDLMWRFCVSGLSSMLLMLILVGLAWALVLREEWGRNEACGTGRLAGMGALIGMLVGLGALTRYSFALVIVPVILFLILFGGRSKSQTILTTLLGLVLVLVPWLARNYYLSGHVFGTASYALIANTNDVFAGNRLERSLQPQLFVPALLRVASLKLFTNVRSILESELPKLGGTWLSGFFLVGLMIGYKREGPQRLRYFLLVCIPVFVLAQALGRTYLSDDSPEINTENLLVLLTPFVIVFGVSLFFLLLDQVQVPAIQLRYLIIGVFLALVSLPMFLVFCPPKRIPQNPPYFPAFIQYAASEVKEKELTMSDIPWAMAWYGRRQCVWLTHNPLPPEQEASKEDLLAIHDYLKPVAELYLSPVTIDRKLLAGDKAWGSFVLSILVSREVPENFPLRTTLQSLDLAVRQGHIVLVGWDPKLRDKMRR
jgi:hypothetical protein